MKVTLTCPNGCDLNVPGMALYCNDMVEGPFYCPKCRGLVKMEEGMKVEVEKIETMPLGGGEGLYDVLFGEILYRLTALEVRVEVLEKGDRGSED